MTIQDRIQTSAKFIREEFSSAPKIAIITGTGLSSLAEKLTGKKNLTFRDIPYFLPTTVSGHKGELIYGKLKGIPVLLLSGRLHYYEGYSSAEVSFVVRILNQLGVKELIITNAAGAVNPHFNEGDLVVITDHINLMPDNPLRGPNIQEQGVRYPDMLDAYDSSAISFVKKIAFDSGINLKEGIYLGLQGPSLETAAEYRMAHRLGADMVGMSTVPEVIVARHCGMKVLAFSIISNICFPKSRLTPTTIESVIHTVENATTPLEAIIENYIYSNQINRHE